MSSIARKELFRKELENNIEVIKNKIIRFEIPSNIIFDINCIFDDYEYAQEHGVFFDWRTDDLFIIKIDDMIQELKDRQYDEEENYHIEKRLIKYFEKYSGFDIWI